MLSKVKPYSFLECNYNMYCLRTDCGVIVQLLSIAFEFKFTLVFHKRLQLND